MPVKNDITISEYLFPAEGQNKQLGGIQKKSELVYPQAHCSLQNWYIFELTDENHVQVLYWYTTTVHEELTVKLHPPAQLQ